MHKYVSSERDNNMENIILYVVIRKYWIFAYQEVFVWTTSAVFFHLNLKFCDFWYQKLGQHLWDSFLGHAWDSINQSLIGLQYNKKNNVIGFTDLVSIVLCNANIWIRPLFVEISIKTNAFISLQFCFPRPLLLKVGGCASKRV